MDGGRRRRDLRAGDECKFFIRDPAPGSNPGDKDGKSTATRLAALTAEDRAPKVVAEGVEGTVARALRGRTKMDSYGGRVSFAAKAEDDDEKRATDKKRAADADDTPSKLAAVREVPGGHLRSSPPPGTTSSPHAARVCRF